MASVRARRGRFCRYEPAPRKPGFGRERFIASKGETKGKGKMAQGGTALPVKGEAARTARHRYLDS